MAKKKRTPAKQKAVKTKTHTIFLTQKKGEPQKYYTGLECTLESESTPALLESHGYRRVDDDPFDAKRFPHLERIMRFEKTEEPNDEPLLPSRG